MARPAVTPWSARRAVATGLLCAGFVFVQPAWPGSTLNLFVVVEAGDNHVSLVDGKRFEVIHRFALRGALHGQPKFSPDGQQAYFASRDGWITKLDLRTLTVVAEARAGTNLNMLAITGDGRWVMVANSQPHTLMLFDSDLKLQRRYDAATLDGKRSSPVAAVYDAPPRRSFVATLPGIAQLWEISYDTQAESIHDGLVHDYRMGEAIATPGYLGVRRTPLDEPLCELVFDASHRHALGDTCAAGGTATHVQVINLDIRRRIASLPMHGPVTIFPLSGATPQGNAAR